jgi:hypothetical protein
MRSAGIVRLTFSAAAFMFFFLSLCHGLHSSIKGRTANGFGFDVPTLHLPVTGRSRRIFNGMSGQMLIGFSAGFFMP